MNSREFFDLVVQMRSAQRDYFKTRSATALNESKKLERAVDAEVKRVNDIINENPKLF